MENNNTKRTALMAVAENNCCDDRLDILLKSQEIKLNARDATGKTALMYAAENNSTYVLKRLLKDKRVDVNARDDQGNTALMYALKNNRADKYKNVSINESIKDKDDFPRNELVMKRENMFDWRRLNDKSTSADNSYVTLYWFQSETKYKKSLN